MKRFLPAVWVALWLPALLPAQNGFVIDRHAVALFDHIPDTFLTAARQMRLMFSDRSVGQNIHEALDYFQAASWAQTPASARRDYTDSLWNWKTYSAADWAAGAVPERIRFNPDPEKYDRSNWVFEPKSGSWSELTQDFIQTLGPDYEDQVDVWSYQFSYLSVIEGDNIAHPANGFFSDHPTLFDVHDLESYLAQHPDITFFYWTTSLARDIGSSVSTAFNEQMRQYCQANGKILLDMADIISHTDKGVPCFDNRDGVPYTAMTGQSENHPDDGFDHPAICQDYTTETEGGHLGSVSAGKVMIAKAFWVLMARIAGWDGQTGEGDPPPALVDTAHHWVAQMTTFGGPVTRRYRFSGDSVLMDGQYYHTIQSSPEPTGNNWEDGPAIREADRKVWLYEPGGEVLLFDYTAEVGDTIKREYAWDTLRYVVKAVDSLQLLDGSWRKRIALNCPDDPGGFWFGDILWVEGLGAIQLELPGYTFPCATDIGGYMTCFYRHEEQLYQAPGVGSCWPTTAVEEPVATEVRLYPNPVSGVLYLDGPGVYERAEGMTPSGRSMGVFERPAAGMDVSGWPAGMYYLRVYREGRPPLMRAFVKVTGR
ncbi:MAG: hypothetical protein J5I41_01945 [Saprospiraceae bacterium]|nr:hypothetical protein [Saprospiraceae bacterium]